MGKAIRTIIIIILLGVMAFCGWKIYSIMSEYKRGEEEYTKLEDYVDTEEEDEDETGEKIKEIVFPEVDFASLQEINPDIVGWIYAKGTHINYPIVQGKDNAYYLHRTFRGEVNSSGSIFMDSDNARDFSQPNTILYGHHMKNGSMFHDLEEYKEQKFYDKHPYMLLMTPDHNYIVHIFSGYVANVENNAWTVFFQFDEEYTKWLKESAAKSCFTSKFVPKETDHVVTLSTCSYEFNNARYVLLGSLEEIDGKSFILDEKIK